MRTGVSNMVTPLAYFNEINIFNTAEIRHLCLLQFEIVLFLTYEKV